MAAGVWWALAAAGVAAEDLTQAAHISRASYTTAMEELAVWCDQHGLKQQAEVTRAPFAKPDPYKFYVVLLPQQPADSTLPKDASADVIEWNARLTRLKHAQAEALWELARRAAKSQRASLAFELILAALRENPDHEAIRNLLGYQRYEGRWCTAYEVSKLRGGRVWHDKFGWLLASQVARYEKGQRYSGGRWISAEEDARLHRAMQAGWDIETEHYSIRTNHSIEAGVRLGAKLEQLYRVWEQLFVRFYMTDAQLLAAFEGHGRAQSSEHRRHQVAYYRDQEEYNRALRAIVPNIGISIGLYYNPTHRVYCFAGKEQDDRTLFHEGTHQLFSESRATSPNAGRTNNFWMIEGVALFMESLHQENGGWALGGVDDVRFHAAQYRLLQDHFYVPLGEFVGYGMDRLQNDKRIATLYSQAAGLTHFLMFYAGGRYREALVNYLNAIYNGRDTANTLSGLTETSYADLDRQYREFMEAALPRE